jgi:glutamate-ammonia-ligase adenylyltransferase
MRDRTRLEADLAAFAGGTETAEEWLDSLRRFRRREMLRIGTRDLCLRAPLEEITSDLSALAETILQAALETEWNRLDPPAGMPRPREHLCVLALGKLGGRELNYSSDIDLLCVYDDAALGRSPAAAEGVSIFPRVVERARHALSAHTGEGHAYRVDFRLRPHGASGMLVQSLSSVVRYYREEAALWEVQALLKARPVTGTADLSFRVTRALDAVLRAPRSADEIKASITTMRDRSVQTAAAGSADVKSGLGGIRDIEFLVQGLQLLHLPQHPALLTGNTLAALRRLGRAGLLSSDEAASLAKDYSFLRRVEHCLQIMEDRQIHAVPPDTRQRRALARRVAGSGSDEKLLDRTLELARHRSRTAFLQYLSPDT